MDTSQWIRATHKCCACNTPLQEMGTAHINLMQLDRKATWEYPTYGNVLQGTSGIAGAVVCDLCLQSNATIKWAIEYQGSGKKKTVLYHDVNALEKIDPPEPGKTGYDPDYDIFE